MNKELLLKVKAAILSKPDRFDMNEYFKQKGTNGSSALLRQFEGNSCEIMKSCGTTACIAGFALALEGTKVRNDWSVHEQAGQVLDLNGEEAARLFYCSSWPEEFRDVVVGGETWNCPADVAAARIDHFIATNGEE